ncbi:hypothetical protein CLM62_33615 [Streptomyces sp. SA15]|nr:hypothetical protein CLM62_33615 [Streptomyces sp. SA15]
MRAELAGLARKPRPFSPRRAACASGKPGFGSSTSMSRPPCSVNVRWTFIWAAAPLVGCAWTTALYARRASASTAESMSPDHCVRASRLRAVPISCRTLTGTRAYELDHTGAGPAERAAPGRG